MNISVLGAHNCESAATKCVCFLVDGTLAIDAGSLTSNLSISNQIKLNAILLTHQHFDHVRDIPSIALNLSMHGASIDVYSTPYVRTALETHLFNGMVYPRFQELPEEKPTVSFRPVVPYESQRIDGHSILPVPVNHSDGTVGYQVSDTEGKRMFYTSDTGPGLLDCWKHVSPHLLIIDVTMSNINEAFARKTGHLTPNLLREELIAFQKCKGYLPQIVVAHMNTALEKRIEEEVAAVAEALDTAITIASEGMLIHI